MLNKNSYKKGVLWMLLFNIIARGISFILSIILAKNFLPADTDVYLYVWSLINVVMMIVSTVNLMAAGPEYIRLSENGEEKEAAKLNSAFLNIYLAPLLVFTLFTLVVPVATYKAISGFREAQLVPFKEMFRYSGLWLILVIVNSFLGNMLLSRKYFSASVLGQFLAAAITLLFILCFKKDFGIRSFFIGQIVGSLLCFIFYMYQTRVRIKEKLSLFYFRMRPRIRKEMVASLLISLPTLVTNFILVYLLSQLVTGKLSAYNYGTTLANLPDVIFLSQIISVIGVKFSEISASRQQDILFNALRFFGYHLFFLMSGLAIIITLTSPAIIQIFYGKESLGGVTFNAASFTLTLISATLAFKALDSLHNRVFASLQALSVLMKYTLPIKILSIGLLVWLSSRYGFEGILVHQLAMPVLMVLLQFYLLSKYLPAQKIRSYIIHLALILIGSLAVYAGCRFLLAYVFTSISPLIQVLMLCGIVVGIGIIFERIFKITMFFKELSKWQKRFSKRPA